MEKNRFIDYQERLLLKLQDDEFAMAYLNEALHDADPRIFLLALRNVLQAQKKALATLAHESSVARMSANRILSKAGNPKWTSIRSLLDAAGLHLSIHSSKNG